MFAWKLASRAEVPLLIAFADLTRFAAHFGRVVAGPFGAAAEKRFDVLGKEVNAAAILDSTGVALSSKRSASSSRRRGSVSRSTHRR